MMVNLKRQPVKYINLIKMSCKQFSIHVFTLLLIVSCNSIKNETQKPNLKIWYHQPADASVPDNPNGWKDDPEWLKALQKST